MSAADTNPVTFMSPRGRVYTAQQCERIVIQRIAARWKDLLVTGWQSVVRAKFADETWLRSNSGCIPGALVRDLETDAITFGR
jgi:hypothetical protein